MAVSSRVVGELSGTYGFLQSACIVVVLPSPMPSEAVEATVLGPSEERDSSQTR